MNSEHWISRWGAFEFQGSLIWALIPKTHSNTSKYSSNPPSNLEMIETDVFLFFLPYEKCCISNYWSWKWKLYLISSFSLADLKNLLDLCVTFMWHAHTMSQWEGAGQHIYGVGKLETEPSSSASCFLPTYWQCQSLFLRLRILVSNHYYSFQCVYVEIWHWVKCRYGIF